MAQNQATPTQGSGTPGLRKVVDNQSVGEILLNGRLAMGEDLAQVAEGLKIRRAFIEALENDDFGALPGTAYGIGFVRAYADYLDLDSKEVVELYKAQSRAFNDQTQLVFPEPMPGSRVPTGLVIILSLLLIGAAYGGWTVLSEKDRSIADLIPTVPEFLNDLQNTASETIATNEALDIVSDEGVSTAEQATDVATETEAVSEQPAAETAAVTGTDAVTTAESAEPGAETEETNTAEAVSDADSTAVAIEQSSGQTDAVTETDAVAETESVTDDNAEPVTGSGAVNDAVEPVVSDPVDAAVADTAETVASAEESVALNAGTVSNEPETVVEDETAAVIDSAQSTVAAVIPEAPSDEVTVYGETEGASRVSIVARQATWVEISDADGTILLTRLLRKGDIYQAPVQDGLSLVTGNAGGLEFRVDGNTVPDIGPVGSVRRNVILSPEALIAGTAGSEGQ
ncbi:MAG: DUF4115 domain-containing protein [Alphaproteobacteria bacterium]